MAKFDWQQREIGISEPFWPTGDRAADFGVIDRYFAGVRGRYPELSYGSGKALEGSAKDQAYTSD